MDRDKDRLDELLGKALSKKMDDKHIEIPDVHQSWASFERNFVRQRKTYPMVKWIGWIACILVVFVSISIFSLSTPVLSNIADKLDLSNLTSRKSPYEEKGNQNSNVERVFKEVKDLLDIEPTYVSLDEAKLLTSFPIITPTFYDDEEYELKQVMIYTNSHQSISNRVRLDYIYSGQWFTIVEEKIHGQKDLLLEEQATNVYFGNIEGVLRLQDEIAELKWRLDGIEYTIYGMLSKDQILTIAQRLFP